MISSAIAGFLTLVFVAAAVVSGFGFYIEFNRNDPVWMRRALGGFFVFLFLAFFTAKFGGF